MISKIIISLCTLLALSSQADIVVMGSREILSKDPFSYLQWALSNQNQQIKIQLDDIHTRFLTGSSQNSIQWSPQFDSMMKRDAVVAVIDSGVDLEHEDLKNKILRNDIECSQDKHIPLDLTGDRDHNGFDGDCMGWNFIPTQPKINSNGIIDPVQMKQYLRTARRAQDDDGHGTHVAGIIAAESDNNLGIRGVSNRIKILPLKVFQQSERSSHDLATTATISDRVARAIRYATQKKVDVINLSLGWLYFNETPDIEDAIDEANKAGIFVVSAAGNDHNNQPVFPCTYKDVLCVGAINIDGTLSSFSNYGSHVDVLAPGQAILSTWPATLGYTVFGPSNYDFEDGTSQATPFASASLAVMKGIFTDSPRGELLARLLNSTSNAPMLANHPVTTFGLINLSKAILEPYAGLIAPSFKGTHLELVSTQRLSDKSSLQFSLHFSVTNYFRTPITVIIEPEKSQNHLFDFSPLTIKLNAFETKDISLNLRSKNIDSKSLLDIDFEQTIAISISSQSRDSSRSNIGKFHRVFFSDVKLARDFSQEAMTISVLESRASNLRLDKNTPSIDSHSSPLIHLATKYLHSQNLDPEFIRVDADSSHIHVFRFTPDGKLTEVGVISPPGQAFLKPMPLLRFCPSSEPVTCQYWVGGVQINQKTNEAESFSFQILDFNLHPIFEKPLVVTDANIALPTTQNIRFLHVDDHASGLDWIPVYLNTGPMPKADLNPDHYAYERNEEKLRLYYLNPEKQNGIWVFQPHVLQNYQTFETNFDFLAILSQASSDGDTLQVMVHSASPDDRQNNAIAALKYENLLTHQLRFSSTHFQFDLSNQIFLKSVPASGDALDIVSGLFSPRHARTLWLSADAFNVKHENTLSLNLDEESIEGHPIFLFNLENDVENFIEIRSLETEILATGRFNEKNISTKMSLGKSSVLPGQYLSEDFAPIWIKSSPMTTDSPISHTSSPGLFTDDSRIFAPHFYISNLENEKWHHKLRFSWMMPPNCHALNPNLFSDGYYYALIDCQNANTEKIFKIKLDQN